MRRTLLGTLVALLALVMVGGPASADVIGFRDAASDVQVARVSADFESITYQPSTTPNGDVLATRYEHAHDRVILYIRYRELYVPRTAAGWYFHIVGSNHVVRDIDLTATALTVGGRAHMEGPRGSVHCKVASRINYRTNAVKLVFPRRCMGNPRYVRVGNVSYWFSFSKTTAFIYYDDPARVAGTVEQVGAAGRWIRRS